jgi:hypothetical protein
MKYILLTTFLIGSVLAKAQWYGFPNSGMETWTNNTTIADWTLLGGSISKADHVKNGALGAALKNEAASAGKLVTSFPFTKRTPRAFFDYKFVLGSATASDTGKVDIMLTRWNTGSNSREIVARIIWNGIYTDFSWQTFSYPFTYFSTADPDSCFITITSSLNSGYNVNTVLNIDNFAYQALTGVNEQVTKISQVRIYPNPVKTNATLTYELRNDSKVTINISDITGKVVSTFNYEKSAGLQQEQLNLENLRSGIYFYEIKTPDEVKTGKFTISK